MFGAALAALWWISGALPARGGPAGNIDLADRLKLALSVVAGVGGLVALVVAYRRQRVSEQQEDRERTKLFNERFTAASGQLGHDAAAVRLAGVYAMGGLADDWPHQRQVCIDVLCAYLRMPYESDPNAESHRAGENEVRRSIIRTIRNHLRRDAVVGWQGHDFDFSGAVFDGGNFTDAVFSAGTIYFWGAQFVGRGANFRGASFSGSTVDFLGATFSAGTTSFRDATFSGGDVIFRDAAFCGGTVTFNNATFSGSSVSFRGATFSNGTVDFRAWISDGTLSFLNATFTGGAVNFAAATFSGGAIDFVRAKFSGGTVDFCDATFLGGEVRFSRPEDWSKPPSGLPAGRASIGLYLPTADDSF